MIKKKTNCRAERLSLFQFVFVHIHTDALKDAQTGDKNLLKYLKSAVIPFLCGFDYVEKPSIEPFYFILFYFILFSQAAI